MAKPTTREILDAFAEEAAAVFNARFGKNHCVNGSRVTIDALKKFGIEAKPMSVEALAMNKVWWERLNAKRDWPSSQEESDQWAAEGGHSLGIDIHTQGTTDWPGHLVVTARGFLIDSSAVQFQRPQKNINPPHVVVADLYPGWLDRKVALPVEFPDGSALWYRARPDDKSYLDLPGFQRSPWNLEVADGIIQRMKRRLH